MKSVAELQSQLENSESGITRFEILKIMASRAVDLERENATLKDSSISKDRIAEILEESESYEKLKYELFLLFSDSF
ncbi:MAG: hypothetical protein IBX55_00440 [Methyloprofundus sp.]|nr:hypothetical protein [Methyloprofundus sp.]